MKIGAVTWSPGELESFYKQAAIIQKIEEQLKRAQKIDVEFLVFPAYTGLLYQLLQEARLNHNETPLHFEPLDQRFTADQFLQQIQSLVSKYRIYLCPGSYWKKENNRVSHYSCIFDPTGQILLEQSQLYLARWERELELERGIEQNTCKVGDFQVGIVLGTDVFYPQVARALALTGADLLVSPVAFVGEKSRPLQISGLWKDVQQNQVFGVESGLNGELGGKRFWAESMIHAPVEMTPTQDGYLANSKGEESLIVANLDQRLRHRVIANCDFLAQLNPEVYRTMEMFGGKR